MTTAEASPRSAATAIEATLPATATKSALKVVSTLESLGAVLLKLL